MAEITELVSDLLALPASERAAKLRARGDATVVAQELADEIDRLAVTEVTRAMAVSEMLTEFTRDLDDGAVRARALRARAQVLGYAGRFDEALGFYEEAAAAATGAGAMLEAAHARMSSLHALASLGRYDAAIAAGEAARAAFLSAGEQVQAARADVNLGATLQMCDRPADAIAHLNRARPLFADDPVTLAKIDSNRGHAFLGMDAFPEAEQAYLAAQPTFEREGMSWAAAIVAGNLAELATRQGRLQAAFTRFERARRLLEADETPAELARLAAEQADALATLGLLDEAVAAYRAALPQLQAAGMAAEATRAHAGLGRVWMRLDRTEEARPHLEAAASGFDALGLATARARLDVLRSALPDVHQDRRRVRDLLQSAVERLADRPAEEAAARYHLARAALADGDLMTAEQQLAAAMQSAASLDLAPLAADVLHARAALARARGDSDGCRADLRAAIDQLERIRGSLHADRFRAAFHADRMGIYEDAVRAALDAGDAEEALAAVERAKSRSLLDLVGGLDAAECDTAGEDDPAAAALARELAQHRQSLNGLYSRLADAALGDDPAVPLDRWREQIGVSERAIAQLEARLANARGVAGLFAPPIEAPAVLAALPSGGRLVEYFAIGGEVLALVAGDARVVVVGALGSVDALTERVRRLYFQVRRAMRPGATDGARGLRLLEDTQRELEALYSALIAPLRRALGDARRVAIVPHGPLHAVPFPALWSGRHYLMDEFEVVSAPSASVYSRCRAVRPAPRDLAALVLGVPDEAAPCIADEAARVAAVLRGARSLLGASATTAAFAAAAREADLLHIACHGFFSAESPLASGLKLADGWLTMRDIYALRTPARLATLSGCETGRTVVSSGDELVGLTRGFFAAGVSALLVSLWTVNDASTADLMTRFYTDWQGGRGTRRAAECFRAAQQELAASRPHPAFWAPFVMMGDA